MMLQIIFRNKSRMVYGFWHIYEKLTGARAPLAPVWIRLCDSNMTLQRIVIATKMTPPGRMTTTPFAQKWTLTMFMYINIVYVHINLVYVHINCVYLHKLCLCAHKLCLCNINIVYVIFVQTAFHTHAHSVLFFFQNGQRMVHDLANSFNHIFTTAENRCFLRFFKMLDQT